ncbi:phytanoyl-CoA dioxygenase family protein [Baekduia soli]|nr:phytanoyl-CoA dioxygenase family protein [Baekduia soli]
MREAWDQDGFVVLAGVVDGDAIAAYDRELQEVRDRLLVRAPGAGHPSLATRTDAPDAGPVDPYALSAAARAVLVPDRVVLALAELLGAAPLLVDAVGSEAGAPDPGPYRDPTYVSVSEPEALAGLVVALGPASVICHAGSHRLPAERFSGRYRHHNAERDGPQALADHRAGLAAALQEAGDAVQRRTVALEPGDVLLWRADLAHEAVEGRALVAHAIPEHAEPGWFAYRPQRAGRVAYGEAWLASQHYDLADAVEPVGPGPDTGAVEAAFAQHEEGRSGSAAARRRGGLVDSVRGLMGRRGR